MSIWNYNQPNPRTPQSLRFTPYAWAKLLFLRDAGPTEVGAFGISPLHDLLLVRDLHLINQRTSPVTLAFEDEAVADYIDAQVDQGLAMEQVARLWLHTHPGESPLPSSTDEETFSRCFGATDWAVMFILARGGQTYARLRFRAGPSGNIELPVGIDWEAEFAASQKATWQEEYDQCVKPIVAQLFLSGPNLECTEPDYPLADRWDWQDFLPGNGDLSEIDHVYSRS